jgi:iron complex outermembrane receptor protein
MTEISEQEIIVLPPAVIEETHDTPEIITSEEMERNGSRDLFEAVRYTPGVILSGGGRRGESNFSVRGYGADSVPIFVDGIVMSNPYRGEGDAARFLIGDLESIEINKGYSSELLGANTLGGAVLLRTAKPKKLFEASFKTEWGFDSVFNYADATQLVNIGTKQQFFYGKAVIQYRDVDHFRLPSSFEPTALNPQEKGNRLWSDSKDLKLTVMAGFTPFERLENADLDVWLAYVYQDADKGLSTPAAGTPEFEIWDWPQWSRHSISLNAAFNTGALGIDGLFYFDKYDNRLDEYYNLNAYKLGIHAPHSDYDEYSLGARLAGSYDINKRNKVQAAVTYKKEDHRGLRGNITNDEMREETHVNEDTISFGAEYSGKLFDPFTLKAGAGFDTLIPNAYRNDANEYNILAGADYFIVKSTNMLLYTLQAGVFYKLPPAKKIELNQELRLTYARKNHFPTMAQRYSTRYGRNLPNPHLGPEIANHFEAGYSGALFIRNTALNLNAAAYYSIMENKIVTIQLPNPHYPSASVDYSRNLDSTSFYGFEFTPEFTINEYLNGGFSLSFNKYVINKSQSAISALNYYPEFTANAYFVIRPMLEAPKWAKWLNQFSIIPRIEYVSARFADTAGRFELEDYFLADLKLVVDITKYFNFSASVENIFDEYYEIRKNWPMAGRSFKFTFAGKY